MTHTHTTHAFGDIATTPLAPTALIDVTCGRPLASCTCSADSLAASVWWDVRGTLIDGTHPSLRPADSLRTHPAH